MKNILLLLLFVSLFVFSSLSFASFPVIEDDKTEMVYRISPNPLVSDGAGM